MGKNENSEQAKFIREFQKDVLHECLPRLKRGVKMEVTNVYCSQGIKGEEVMLFVSVKG